MTEVEGTRVKGELQVLEFVMAVLRSLVNEVEGRWVNKELLLTKADALLRIVQNGTDRLIVAKGAVLVNDMGPQRQTPSYLRLTNAELYVTAMKELIPTSLYKSHHLHQFSYLMKTMAGI